MRRRTYGASWRSPRHGFQSGERRWLCTSTAPELYNDRFGVEKEEEVMIRLSVRREESEDGDG